MKTFTEKFEEAKSMGEIFEVVKEGVRRVLSYSRAGLSLGLAELGIGSNGIIGAFYPVGSNIIIVNKSLLKAIEKDNSKLLKPYIFHLLLHEYLHALGILSEEQVRELVYKISKKLFGEEHIITAIAKEPEKFMPKIIIPAPQENRNLATMQVELVKDFDRSSINYIS